MEGDFATPHGSLAIVNRGLFGALGRRGNVELALRTEPSPDATADLSGEWLQAARARAGERPDVTRAARLAAGSLTVAQRQVRAYAALGVRLVAAELGRVVQGHGR